MGNSSKTTNSSSLSTKAPLIGAQNDAYQDLWMRAKSAVDGTNSKPYVGDFLAGVTPQERQGVDMLTANAGNKGAGVDAIRNLATGTLNGDFLPDLDTYKQNPYLQQVIATALDPIQKNLQESVLPGINSQAISSGAYGGARQDLQQNQAVDNFAKTAAQTTGTISYNDYNDYMNRQTSMYNNERTLQQSAPSLLSAANSLEDAPAQALLQAGQLGRSQNQIGIENDIAKHNEFLKSQWYGLGDLANILQSGGFGTTQSSGTAKETTTPSLGSEIMKGVTGAVSLASGLGWKPF